MIENTTRQFIIDADLSGYRLDKAISVLVPDISRSRVQSLIKQQMVYVDNRPGKWASSKVRDGMKITITIPDNTPLPIKPEAIALDVVFEDDHLLLINKPSGMVVHPAPGNETGTLVNAVLHHAHSSLSGIGGVKRPGIVHRIDKDTSGVLVVAKSDAAHNGLTTLFKSHDIDRSYVAFVWGHTKPVGVIRGNIGRHKTDRKKMALLPQGDKTGKTAITHYKTIRRFGNTASRVECTLETGRTHQIRVHMADNGNGLIGDPVYGRIPQRIRKHHPTLYTFLQSFCRQALHAKSLGFVHPITKKYIFVDTKLPNDLESLEKILLLD